MKIEITKLDDEKYKILLQENYGSIKIQKKTHLHLEIKKLVTRVIIKLVNNGYHLVITTHSDIIFQHINNMIKLYNLKNKDTLLQRFNYSKDDILNPENVKAYEFKIINNKTQVIPLKLNKQGFEVPSFNKTLIDLSEETMFLSEGLDE